ncbi:hypothetical protein CDLVIII_5775 [Clostridium sp. DL-VIII]|uniref:DUF4179 domain-containing protein n=1 Tax=Clostridium sp. DL-VIII TaxID=641107 RepID=UPI00023B08C9|nr:DUF4179 domain-containing protein [Clostridium sp. DL-VIII]EHJ02243.1 hypothetical protein CDLVIII_5775 [Clostridium sp. DL-VIII]
MKKIKIDNIEVSSKLDGLINNAIKEGYRDYSNNKTKKKAHKRNILVAGMVVALTVTLFGTNVGAEVLTKVLVITGIDDISSFFGIAKSLDEYKTVVNKSVTDNGITVKLNEVILDGSEIIVSYSESADKKLGESIRPVHIKGNIYINGKKANEENINNFHSKVIDVYSTQEVITYDLENIDLSGSLDIKIECQSIELENGSEKKGKWNFEFKADGNELKADTREIELNNRFTIEDGTEYTLKKYTDNSLGQKIYASISNFKTSKKYNLILLIGTDDLGNKVEFYSLNSDEDHALFKIQRHGLNNLNENAKILTLTPYDVELQKGGGKSELKQVGEAFTIDLSQLK